MWCALWAKKYIDEHEKDSRFLIFEKALSRPRTMGLFDYNVSSYADRTPEELEDIHVTT
ncbi:hypothetical protein A2U01_0064606, partial [Trifolium medium]|nr:hypothetical protein [Trifolium medium]